MRRLVFLTVIFCLAALPALADEIELTYDFNAPVLIPHENGTVEPVIAGLNQHLLPGYPIVPVRTAWITLPPDQEVVSVQVAPGKSVAIADAVAAWCPRFQPLSEPGREALPNAAVYNGDQPFPAAVYRPLSVQYKRGAAILPVALYPVSYQPDTQQLSFLPSITVRVTTRFAPPPAGVLPFRGLNADLRELRLRVDNPEVLAEYQPATVPTRDAVDYLVISPPEFHEALQDLLVHKTEMFGLRCEMIGYEELLQNTPGATIPERIRNYIIERYNDGLQYVLLVGDANHGDEVIKLRGLFVTGVDPDDGQRYTDYNMAADQYYGCLDGNYNFDGDAFWGEVEDGIEGGDVDLLYDVHVGRFAVEQPWEARIMAGKTIAFENDYEMPWRLLFVGEYADSITWGGDNKDEVYTHCGDMTIPVVKLYDRDGTNTHNNVVRAINSNEFQWLNHLGHANTTSNMGFHPGSVDDLTNERFYLGFSQGCYSGAVDGSDVYGWTGTDCMAEQFTEKSVHGAFAYFMNTRYGFYLTGRVDGPSNVYDWELAEAFFNDGIPHIGAAMDKGKEDCIGLLSDANTMRWAWYTLFLFGDPHASMRLNCDNDADGFVWSYCGGDDCDDENQAVNPDADEICDDGLDNDCNGLVDADDPACAVTDDDTADDDIGDDDISDDDLTDDDMADDDLTDDDVADDDAADDDNDDSGGCGC